MLDNKYKGNATREVILITKKKKKEDAGSTLIMSIGWMTQVASIPEAPPLTKGLTVGQTPADLGFFSSPMSESEREGESSRDTEKWPPPPPTL